MNVENNFRTSPEQRRRAALTLATGARDAVELAEWLAMCELDPAETGPESAVETSEGAGPRLDLPHSWFRSHRRSQRP